MKTGRLKNKTLKYIIKHLDGCPSPTMYLFAEPGTKVYWAGETGNPEHYGGRVLRWCELETGESVGLEESEVEWDENTN